MGGEFNYSALEIRFAMNGVRKIPEILHLLDVINEYLNEKAKNEQK